jgi:membrane-bound lytic murein transglycosylase D
MEIKRMIKKHLFTCSVMLVMAVIFKLNICSISVNTGAIKSTYGSKFIFLNNDDAATYSFANEALPINNAKVSRKMRITLIKHDFKNVQSNILHLKAERLFPIIEPILRAYGIPDDFKYLPLVESGLKEGTSPKGAAGLWQFMPGTARTYGLKVGKRLDERLNVRKSTVAACKYIKELYGEFNSWTLAAAAYNNGSIKLERAINKQSQDNYFRMHLNRETGDYIYNILAMKEIIVKPAKYGYNGLYSYVPQAQLLQYN